MPILRGCIPTSQLATPKAQCHELKHGAPQVVLDRLHGVDAALAPPMGENRRPAAELAAPLLPVSLDDPPAVPVAPLPPAPSRHPPAGTCPPLATRGSAGCSVPSRLPLGKL